MVNPFFYYICSGNHNPKEVAMCATIFYSAFRCKLLCVVAMCLVCLNADAQGRNDSVWWPPYSLFVKPKFRTSPAHRPRVFRDEDYAKPKFPGGEEALEAFIDKEKVYPEEVQDVTGRVILSFFVEEDGQITDIRLLRCVHPALDKAAVNVVKKMPAWIPGKRKGKVARLKVCMGIPFYVIKKGGAEAER